MTDAVLALAGGALFKGAALGVAGQAVGEVVFNTAMTGYQEILTDPSYAQQIITLTHPHIGNTGVNPEDEEAPKIHAAGLVVRDLSPCPSSWRQTGTLADYLRDRQLVAIGGVDTRRLTRLLREEGAQNACLLALPNGQPVTSAHTKKALAAARRFPGLAGMDLAKEVTTPNRYQWQEGSWQLGKGYARPIESPPATTTPPALNKQHPAATTPPAEGEFANAKALAVGGQPTKRPALQTTTLTTAPPPATYNVVAYDFGAKRNLLRLLVDRGCAITVVPAQTTATQALKLQPDGIFLSNGPGDPEPCAYAIAAIRELLAAEKPIFGICLGMQLLGLATGMQTMKMSFGHHGANHPVQCLEDGKALITSQNHGFCLSETPLPKNVEITHRSLFDGSIQGIRLTDQPAFGFQGHPEASPGPQDAQPIFDQFIALMQQRQEAPHA